MGFESLFLDDQTRGDAAESADRDSLRPRGAPPAQGPSEERQAHQAMDVAIRAVCVARDRRQTDQHGHDRRHHDGALADLGNQAGNGAPQSANLPSAALQSVINLYISISYRIFRTSSEHKICYKT